MSDGELHQHAAVYLDDVMIHSDTWAKHMQRDAAVLQGFTTNPKKCADADGEDSSCCILFSSQDQKKKKEMQQFLGLADYFCRFIPNFVELTSPLTNLTQKSASESYQSMI